MRNQTTKSHNAKSKIFITLLCIFGLLFSYSCQCKNNVSDPNNIPPDGGLGGGGGGGSQTDTDPDKDLVDGALSTTSTKVIVVAGAGDTVKTTSTIKFKNATATLKSFEDTDSTTLTDGDIVYEGTTLTLKADTTDASKIDTTVGGKITWEKASKKITATFTLTPAENVTLSETEKTVVIEIYKEKLLPTSEAKDLVQKIGNLQFDGGGLVNFYESGMAVDDNSITAKVEYGNGVPTSYSKSKWKEFFITKIKELNANKNFDVEFTSDNDAGGGKWLFELKFTFRDTDYDLTDDQKANGVKYSVYVDFNGGGLTWTE